MATMMTLVPMNNEIGINKCRKTRKNKHFIETSTKGLQIKYKTINCELQTPIVGHFMS